MKHENTHRCGHYNASVYVSNISTNQYLLYPKTFDMNLPIYSLRWHGHTGTFLHSSARLVLATSEDTIGIGLIISYLCVALGSALNSSQTIP